MTDDVITSIQKQKKIKRKIKNEHQLIRYKNRFIFFVYLFSDMEFGSLCTYSRPTFLFQ